MDTKNRNQLLWVMGGAVIAAVGYAVYKSLSRDKKADEQTLPERIPVKIAVPLGVPEKKAFPHFERKHPYPERDHAHQMHSNEHRPHVGNGPGARNQIGGRRG